VLPYGGNEAPKLAPEASSGHWTTNPDDVAVSEARERVRAALVASGLALPARRITDLEQALLNAKCDTTILDLRNAIEAGFSPIDKPKMLLSLPR
jgi:hypothetical protein